MQKMIAAYGEKISFTGKDKDIHFGLCQFQTGCKRDCPAMGGMKGIEVKIAGNPSCASDTGNNGKPVVIDSGFL